MNNVGLSLTELAGFLPTILRFVFNTLAVWCITHCLYFPKSRRREYYFTFMLIGISVFFLINLLGGAQIKIEFALGLFAIFGIIRYRTESMPVREMTYLFMIIAMSVINGLASSLGWIPLIVVNLLFILTTWIFERVKIKGTMAVKLIQYDRIELIKPEKHEELLADLKERTGLDIVRVEIGGIDFLRDMAVIKISYRSPEDANSTVNEQTKVRGYQWRNFCLLALLSFVPFIGVKAQDTDFGVWMDAGVVKKFNKHWSINGELGARTRDNLNNMDRWSLGIGGTYKLNSYLKFSAGYDFLYDHRPTEVKYNKKGTKIKKITPQYWWPRHRFTVGATGSYSFGHLGLSVRELWQYTYRAKAKNKRLLYNENEWEDVKSKSQHLLRSRFQMKYDIKKCHLEPYASVELYHGEGGLQKTRYTIGTSYAITKHHEVDVYYRYQDMNRDDDDDVNIHVLGLGYTYSF